MKRSYHVTPEARADLLTIHEFIARDEERAAGRLIILFERAFQLLARFPRKGHRRTDIKTTEPVLFWPLGSYVIVYKSAKPIVIVRVLHGARDLNALL